MNAVDVNGKEELPEGIETGVPMPRKVKALGRKSLYRFKELRQVGWSVWVKTEATLQAVQQMGSRAARSMDENPIPGFTVREEVKDGVRGVRVWRTR